MTTAAPSAARHGAGRKTSRLWWHIHQWVGLKLAIFLSFVCATGTLAVLSNEIDWLLQPSLRVVPSSVGAEPRWDRIGAAALAYPGAARVNLLSAPVASAFAATATIERHDGRSAILHIHPETGVVQGEGPWVGAQRVLRNLHRHLNLPVKYGVPVVSALGFLMLVSFVTSFIVYKRWWRGFLKPVRKRDARTAWGDFHRLAGLWSLWFLALIAITGIWYFAESVGLDAPDMAKAKARASVESPVAAQDYLRSLAAARAAFPALRIERVAIPRKAGDPFEFQGQYRAWLVRERSNAVVTDPGDAAVLLIRDGQVLNLHQRISEMADPLHFGTFGGYWTKIPWFLFGLLLTALCVSGAAIHGLRIARQVPEGATRSAWRGMGQWRWLALGLVVTGFAMLPSLFAAP